MTPGPWSIGRLMGGFCVQDTKRTNIAEMRGSRLPFQEHKANAVAIAAVPELVDVLMMAESYFGDLPSSDKAAMRIHGRLVRVLNTVGIEPDDAA